MSIQGSNTGLSLIPTAQSSSGGTTVVQGSQGPVGPAGPQGPQGPPGGLGPQGPKGDTGVVDTSQFYTKSQTDTLIADALPPLGIDFSNYYNKEETDASLDIKSKLVRCLYKNSNGRGVSIKTK
jgi:hypothetical protein